MPAASNARRSEVEPAAELHQEDVARRRAGEQVADVAAEAEVAVVALEPLLAPLLKTTNNAEPGLYSQRSTLVVRNERKLKSALSA